MQPPLYLWPAHSPITTILHVISRLCRLETVEVEAEVPLICSRHAHGMCVITLFCQQLLKADSTRLH